MILFVKIKKEKPSRVTKCSCSHWKFCYSWTRLFQTIVPSVTVCQLSKALLNPLHFAGVMFILNSITCKHFHSTVKFGKVAPFRKIKLLTKSSRPVIWSSKSSVETLSSSTTQLICNFLIPYPTGTNLAEIHENKMKYAQIRTVQPWAVYHFVFSVKEGPGFHLGQDPF